MPGKGSFTSYLKGIQKDMHSAEGRVLKKAGLHLRRTIRKKIGKRKVSTAGQPPGKGSGNLRKGIAYKVIVPPVNSFKEAVAIVGGTRPAYHLHLMELGTKERFKSGGQPTGKVDERPVIKPSFQEEAGAVERILSEKWL